MRRRAIVALAILLLTAQEPWGHNSSVAATTAGNPLPAGEARTTAWLTPPLSFEVNRGQASSGIKFLAREQGYTAGLTPTGVILTPRGAGALRSRVHSLRLDPLHVSPHSQIVGVHRLPGRVNYFIGSNPRKWHTDIPTYARVTYRDIYPGIDLVFHGSSAPPAAQSLEYDWVIHPGADPSTISMAIRGAQEIRTDAHRNLEIQLGGARLIQQKPVAYQLGGGRQRPVTSSFVQHGANVLTLSLGHYDRTKPLVIDPTLVYSTYLGGSGDDSGNGIAVDGQGNAYITGSTQSPDFPLAHPEQSSLDQSCADTEGVICPDAFVTKLDPSGSTVLYSTYIGGVGTDVANSIALDASGSAYIVGTTDSANFPTHNPLQASYGGGTQIGDAFVAKLSPAGDALDYSTYLGGTADEQGNGIAVDGSGSAFVTGSTNSVNFPALGGIQRLQGGTCVYGTQGDKTFPCHDAFVVRLSPSGQSLMYSTFLGGTQEDNGQAIAIDGAGNAYITGETSSTDFPTTTGSFQSSRDSGEVNAFVTKLDPSGGHLIYSTYLGGGVSDQGEGIAVDAAGNAYVTGATQSADFPVTAGVVQPESGGSDDAFVTKLNAAGNGLVYSTYLGGAGLDEGSGVAVDQTGDAFVTGDTSSADFPISQGLQPPRFTADGISSDAFVTELDPTGQNLVYSTFLGGGSDEHGQSIAVDRGGNTYVTGTTSSSDFPTVHAFQKDQEGDNAYAAKIGGPASAPSTTPTAAPTVIPTAAPKASPVPSKGTTRTKKKHIRCRRGYKLVRGKCKKVKHHR